MKNTKKALSMLAAASLLAMSFAGCTSQTPAPAPAASTAEASVEDTADTSAEATTEETQEAEGLTPAYSVDDYETVDADGNRVTTGRDATGTKGMASASKYEVSQVGAEIMSKGGNAIDAAVAMGFALCVCEPFTSGIGGGGIATIHLADGTNTFVDFREVAPAASDPELYRYAEGKKNEKITKGGLASGVPGDLAGLLYMLDKYGTMDRADVMEPAIRIAREGFVVSTYCANAISDAYEKAQEFPEMQKVYWDENGLPYDAGAVINNPDLADTLQLIADEGADAFYKGEIGEDMIATLAKYDGNMTMEDLANYEVMEHEPVEGDYRGYHIISSPPPSSGGTHLIEILNILENVDVGAMDINSTEYIHWFTEAFKLAYADRAAYMADTAFTTVPLGGLTSQEYADVRFATIDPEKANDEVTADDPFNYEHTDTTHFSVADAEGNIVGITKTINYYFGSGVMVEGRGFMMNNQMDDFEVDPDSVNVVEPGKKPLSSMSPTIVLNEDGSPFMVLGTPGGMRIFVSVLQVISRVIDHGMSIHDAICVPKIWNNGARNNFSYENPLKGYEQYEITEETLKELEEMGHGEGATAASGSIQAIVFNEDGSLYGTADPRQDGKAVGVN